MQDDIEIEYGHIEAPTKSVPGSKPRKLRSSSADICFSNTDAWTKKEFEYLKDMTWVARKKFDGTQVRISWDGNRVRWNGKTNNCDKFSSEIQSYFRETFPEELFEEHFGREKKVTFFGELMGPKIQNNELNLTRPEIILFDLLVDGVFYNRSAFQHFADVFSCRTSDNFWRDSDSLVRFIQRISSGELKAFEGIVCTPISELRDNKGGRVICKIKAKDYYPPFKEGTHSIEDDIVFRIWVDDERPAPSQEYDCWAESVFDTITDIAANLDALVQKQDKMLLDMDHDAGEKARFGGDFIKVLEYLADQSKDVVFEDENGEEDPMFLIRIHTANPVGAKNMRRIIEDSRWMKEIE